MPNVLDGTVEIRLKVSVYLDPNDPELIAATANPCQRYQELIAVEIVANLESISYVSHVTANCESTKEES